MGRLWTIAWLGLAGSLGLGCGVDIIEVDVTESGAVGMAGLSFPGMEQLGASLGRALTDKDVNPADVDSLKLTRAHLAHRSLGVQPDDLSFLHDLHLDVSASGLTTATLAEQTAFGDGVRDVDLPVVELELKPYLDTGALRMALEASVNPPPMAAIELELGLRFRVDVNVI